ncbi:MAG: DUF3883 domain-containing protein, partial [Conexivisphaerales archaeon]
AEQEFRDKEGAQVMVATEAAGEGINLQFCWMMINYDIPWNPMRLEQRMGRIHRYGQEHDCLIFNFVAMNTREGQVLEKLLERLKEIRRELGTDRVFDVVGEVFPANQLEKLMRELYAGKTTFQALMDRVVKDVDQEHFKKITESTLEGLAKKELNLSAIVGKKELAKERRLIPEVVEQFFMESVPIVGLSPLEERNNVFRVGRLPRALIDVGERLEMRFGPLAREYKWITFDRKLLKDEPTMEWVTPGHPLFEVVREELLSQVRVDLQNGVVFYDLYREEPALLDVFAASIKDGNGNTLHRRLFVVETSQSGVMNLRQPTLFLDLSPAPKSTITPDQSVLPDKQSIESMLYEKALIPFLEEVQSERLKEIDTIEHHVELSLNELINRQNVMLAGFIERQQRGQEFTGLVSQTESRILELNERLERRKEDLKRERQLTVGDITHIGRAWVLPHPDRREFSYMVADKRTEGIAMEVAMAYEREHGWDPQDVAADDRGFDLLSKSTSGVVRFIEVKGRSAPGIVAPTYNELATARRLGEDYWLYAVFDCATEPRLVRVRNPARLNWKPVVKIDHYEIDFKVLENAAEREAGAA